MMAKSIAGQMEYFTGLASLVALKRNDDKTNES
jgi:hypothetical protein